MIALKASSQFGLACSGLFHNTALFPCSGIVDVSRNGIIRKICNFC